MLAWVTGATGFVGAALVERLLARGDRVVALVRPASRHRAPAGAEIAESVLPDVSGLARAPRPDVVFHCAASIEGTEADGRVIHVEGTLRLAALARGARFVHLSTTDVYPLTSAVPVSETTPCAPHDAYGRTKLEGERRLLEAMSGAIVLRPPGVYGPRSNRIGVLEIARRIERGTFYFVGDGSVLRSWIFVDTLVDAMLYAAEHGELRGVFLVDDGRPVSRREFAEAVARAVGRSARFPRVPAPVAIAAAGMLERTLAPFGLASPISKEAVRQALIGLPLDTSKWMGTGFSPRFDFREAIAKTIAGARSGRG